MASITLKDFSFTHELANKPCLEGINYCFEAGKVYGIIGPNGAGKSTLLHAIRGLIPHYFPGTSRGELLIHEQSVFSLSSAELAKTIGFVFQNPFNQISGAKASVYEEVAYGLENIGIPQEEMAQRIEGILEKTGLTSLADRHPYHLSGGQQQRVALASVLVMDQDILLIDEPTSQLDPESSQYILSIIASLKSKGKTILLVEHEVDFLAQVADELLVLVDGQLLEHGPSSVIFADDHLASYGIPVPQVVRFKSLLKEEGCPLSAGQILGEDLVTNLLQIKGHLKAPLPTEGDNSTSDWPSGKENGLQELAQKGDPLLEIKGASYTYPSGHQALKDVQLAIYPGEKVAIVGQNGAGKTSTVKLLNGLIRPSKGQVLFRGQATKGKTTAQLARHIGYVFQNPDEQLFNATVYEELAYSLKRQPALKANPGEIDRLVHHWAQLCGVDSYLEKNPYDLSLSSRKLVAMAAILTLDPDVIILDEVNAGQDLRGMAQLQTIIDQLITLNKAVIVITHDMAFASRSMDRIVVMVDGQIKGQGRPLDIFSQTRLLQQAHLTPPLSVQLTHALHLHPDRLSLEAVAHETLKQFRR